MTTLTTKAGKKLQTPNSLTMQPSRPSTLASAILIACSSASMADNSFIRSSEGTSYSPEQIGVDIASAPLPDPATVLKMVSSNTIDGYHPDWLINDEAWITDIGTLLYRDSDQDGYFAGFSLTLDADTYHDYLDVHANIDIQRPLGQRKFLHQTSSFSLNSNSFTDEYRVEIELVQNYPAGEFDLFIDLVDSNSLRVLDSVSADEFSNLSALPLESEDFDTQTHLQISLPDQLFLPQVFPQNDDVRVNEYAGSSGIILLFALSALGILRRKLLGSDVT